MSPTSVLRLLACLATLTATAPTASAVELDDLVDILNYGRALSIAIFKSWDVLKEYTDTPQSPDADVAVDLPLLRSKEKRVMSRLAEVSRQLNRLDNKMQAYSTGAINVLLRELPSKIRLEIRLDALTDMISKINVASRQMQRYILYNNNTDLKNWTLERHTIENYAVWITSHQPDAVQSLVERVHLMIAPEDAGVLGRGILHLLRDTMQESGGNLCSLQQSPQQILYNVYNTAALTELKGYAMMQFSWMLLRLYNKGNFTVESRIMQERYKERTEQKIAAVKSAMASAKREIYRCDPKLHVEGETYVQLTRLLQGHIQNEVDMNRDSTCRENCGYYSYAQNHGCYQNMYCARQQKCSGKLIDCKYYDSDMWVCPADSSTSRRYDWIEYENGRVLGQKASCRTGSTKVDSWWRWLFWHCSYCFCLCDEQGPRSDRYFNLRPVEADVANNKVVTGLRLVKHNRLIHMQVQEAPLLPSGGVNASAARWRPVDDYEITDVDVQNGVDYHTLTWEQRAVDLDDLVAPPGHVLTGFRFRKVGTHLNPEIMSTPYNFSAGLLIQPLAKSVWLSNDNTAASLDAPRTQLPLPHADVPTRSQLPSLPDSRPEQFLLFTHSGVDADAAQTTVPFLDAQPLTPEPLTLLAGAGLHHKGRAGYGGFVAPKLITYDYSQHIQALYPPAKN